MIDLAKCFPPLASRQTMIRFAGIATLLCAFTWSSNVLAQEYSPLNRLGTNEAICVGGIQTVEELQAVFVNDSETIAEVLANSAWQGDKSDLDAVIAAGDFVEKSYEPGSRFLWMGARRKNTGVALPFREWAGNEAFVGYEIKVTSQCQVHTLVIPKICCNLALLGSEPEPVAEPLVIVSPAVESVNICTEQGNDLAVFAEDGTRIESPLDGNGCWSGNVAAGNYLARATNPHCSGASTTESFIVAAPATPEPVIQVHKPKKIIVYLAGFAGYEARERPNVDGISTNNDAATAFGVRLGALSPLNDTYSLFGQLGTYTLFGLNDDTDWSSRGVFVDAGFEVQLTERGFMGLGMSLWNIDNKDTHNDDVGYLIYGGGDIADTGSQWFVEGRFFKEAELRSRNNMLSLGIRHLFK